MLGCRAMNLVPDSEEAFETLDKGIGRRDLLRATALVSAGAEPLQDLISALHSKLLVAELTRQREKR